MQYIHVYHIVCLVLFGDEEFAQMILKSDDPREQKSLGRGVRNFDETKWKEKCRDIVKRGNMAKVTLYAS